MKSSSCHPGAHSAKKPVPTNFHLYELAHRSYANRSARSRTLVRADRLFLLCLVSGKGAGATVLDLLSGVHDLNDRGLVENLYKGRSARLGMYHSDLQSLRLVHDRRAAVVVDPFDANSFR